MEPKNQVAAPTQQKFSIAIREDRIQQLINNTLGDPKRAARFTASISSVVATNPALQKCEINTVIASALVGEALDLPPSPQLGYFYLVPFEEKEYNPQTKKRETVRSVATFILGYKGYIQLAIRSGLYTDIDAIEVREGEYLGKDSETGKPRFRFIEDDNAREDKPVIGYLAHLELKTGFKKVIYWPFAKMLAHADKYSKAFSAEEYGLFKAGKTDPKEAWKYSSFWYQNFDGMAQKTMIRQLISKYGIMSVELQTAFENDTSYTDDMGNRQYPDGNPTVDKVVENVKQDVVQQTASESIPPQVAQSEQPKEEVLQGQTTLFPDPTAKPSNGPGF